MKNNNTDKINYSFIAKYLAHETTDADNDVFELWLQEDDNRKTFDEIKTYWKIINKQNRMNNVDVDKAWNKLKSKIEDNCNNEDIFVTEKSITIRTILRYAATILLLIGLSISGYLFYNSSYNPIIYTTIKSSSNTENKIVILPDGSKVYLYADSKINFPKEFNKNIRNVKLNGEAFFKVSKDPQKPFIVSANNSKIKVLGTSFNVNTNLPNKNVEVFVKSGCVKLYNKNNESNNVILNPGFIGTYTETGISKKSNNNVNYISWMTKDLIFRDTELNEVIDVISKTYRIKISYDTPQIEQLRISSTFSKQPIDSVLKIICSTFNLKYKVKNSNEIILMSE